MFSERNVFSAGCKTAFLALAVCFAAFSAGAAEGGKSVELFPGMGSLSGPGKIETNADDMDYDRNTGWIDARGNVLVKKGDQSITADYVRVNVKTENAFAYGNVTLKKGDQVWTGERVEGNFGTGEWDAFGFTGQGEPYRVVESSVIQKKADGSYAAHDAVVTGCTNDPPHSHYHVKASEITVYPEEEMKLRQAIWYFGNIPVFYLPLWNMSLDPDFGWRFNLGYRTRLGAYLLASYRYRLSPVFRSETHVDPYTRRGVALGQDIKWAVTNGYGNMEYYYIDDKKPLDDDEDETADIENERYRFYFDHYQTFSDRDYMLVEGNYLSDTDFLEDYFDDEFEQGVQPENYASFTHREDLYVANLYGQWRMNEFFETVTRLPEASIEFMPQPVGESRFFYEGQTAAAFLEKLYDDTSTTNTDYSAFRVDTEHLVYYPSKHMGFLNVIPRLGYRGTYYSATRESATVSEITASSVTNETIESVGVTNFSVSTSLETNRVTTYADGPAEYRNLFELGVELSYKAFKQWGFEETSRRHIVQPYIDYTLIPEPNVLAEDLYQFDKVDSLGEDHSVKIGARNKYQKKMNKRPYDLVDVDLYAKVRLDPEDDEEQIERFVLDGELRPVPFLRIDFDAEYEMDDGGVLDEFNIRGTMMHDHIVAYGAEFRHKEDDSDLFSGDIMFYPNMPWTYTLFARYEFEEARLEETGMYLQRNYDCMVTRLRLGALPGYTRDDGTEQDDEYQILLEVWLRGDPNMKIGRSSYEGSGLLRDYIDPDLRGDTSSEYYDNPVMY